MTNPDTFALTPEEQDGITIADATENAADPAHQGRGRQHRRAVPPGRP